MIVSEWLAVRRASGAREVIAPHRLTDWHAAGSGDSTPDPIVALDFGRPDLDGAVTEFLIGLMAVALGPKDDAEWAQGWDAPPPPDTLKAALSPLAFAFNLGGDGPRCFQDLDELADAGSVSIQNLFIDSPGENAGKLNTDHFVKRREGALSPKLAAAALITLQTWAPSGGAGHRTSMRGGGPLTTLARCPRRFPDGREIVTLWDLVWLNTPNVRTPPTLDGRLFPWLLETITSEGQEASKIVTEEMTHALTAFFATPRRIRLEFDDAGDAVAYRTKAYGANYPGDKWRHPLSPYYKDKKEQVLPLHPQAGPASYRDWLGVLVNTSGSNVDTRAACVSAAMPRLQRMRVPMKNRRADIVAFGYDQDNAKTRGFVSQSVPFIPAKNPNEFGQAMAAAVEAAEATARFTRYAVQLAQYGEVSISDESGASISLRDEGKKAAEHVFHAFFAETEPAFRTYLDTVADIERFGGTDRARIAFRDACRKAAMRLFEAHVDEDTGDIRRTVLARKQLSIALHGRKTKSYVFKALQLPEPETEATHG